MHSQATIFRIFLLCTVLFQNYCPSGTVEPNKSAISRIVNGQDAVDPIPYQVSIQKFSIRKWSHICGGSIISENYVLTAGHCVMNMKILNNQLSVLAGTNRLDSGGYHHRVVDFKVHPNFRAFNGSDIAVLKVSPVFNLDRATIGTIGFENATDIPGDIPATLSGWGLTKFGYQNNLQTADFLTLSNAQCRLEIFANLSSTDICAIGIWNTSAEMGDSGGPLVNKEQTIQIGISVYGLHNPHGTPGVFTRVSAFVDWIKNEIEN